MSFIKAILYFSETPQESNEDITFAKDDSLSVQSANLLKAIKFSSKVSRTSSYLHESKYSNSIVSVMIEDAKRWKAIFESYQSALIKNVFSKWLKRLDFIEYLGTIFESSYPISYKTFISDYQIDEHDDYDYDSNEQDPDTSSIVAIQDLLCYSIEDKLLFLTNFMPKVGENVISKYSMPLKDKNEIQKISNDCVLYILPMFMKDDHNACTPERYEPEHLFSILYACSNSCQDIYDQLEQLNSQSTNDISSNLSYMRSLLYPELILDLFCLKSPQGTPFCGQIHGHSWLYNVLDSGIFSIISTDLTQKYVPNNDSRKFDQNKSNAFDCITHMSKEKDQFAFEQFYQVFYALSNSCQNVYDIVNELEKNETKSISSNLIYLNSELLSEEFFVDLMMSKSKTESPFTGQIIMKSWLSRVIESEQPSVLSYLFLNKKEDICSLIKESGKDAFDASKSLISLLLEKSDNYRMLRREFFMILTTVHDRDESIAYVKKHCKDTSSVSLKSVQELKDLFPYTIVQKLGLLLSLFISFLLGSLSYIVDVGADYSLLYESHKCDIMSNLTHHTNFTSKFLNSSDLSNVTSHANLTSKCFNGSEFCAYTVGSFNYYFEYTLIICLVPLVLNTMLVAIDIRKNGKESLMWLPNRILKHHSFDTDHPCIYRVLSIFHWIIWAPFLIVLYPIATKFAYIPASYKLHISSRSISCIKGKRQQVSEESKSTNTKVFYAGINQSLNSEIIKASTLEVVTESTLQPLLQLFVMTSTCKFSDQFTISNLFSSAVITNPLLFSVVTSLISFSWSMTTYHVYTKQGALGIQSNLKGRLLLFAYFLVYIVSRMFILIIAAHQVFGGFGFFQIFIILHVILMFIVHYVHLYKMKLERNPKSVSFWIESLINSVGCILIPNNIKYARKEENDINQRYHEPNSFRYLLMHLIFLIENLILVTLCYFNIRKSSILYGVFEHPDDNNFIKMFPIWTLGLFLLALVFKFVYYQTHAWPISPNCFTMSFLCPFDQEQKESEETEASEGVGGKYCMITKELR